MIQLFWSCWCRYYWNATNNVDVLWDPPPGVRLEGTFLNAQIIREMGVFINGGTSKWMVSVRENPNLKWMIWD